jgi:hypothetical protein
VITQNITDLPFTSCTEAPNRQFYNNEVHQDISTVQTYVLDNLFCAKDEALEKMSLNGQYFNERFEFVRLVVKPCIGPTCAPIEKV